MSDTVFRHRAEIESRIEIPSHLRPRTRGITKKGQFKSSVPKKSLNDKYSHLAIFRDKPIFRKKNATY